MIKTSVVRKVSVDDVRGISHLTCIGMMTADIFDPENEFDYFDREDFFYLINNYVMRCNPDNYSIEYATVGKMHKRVIFEPAGLDGIKVRYYLGNHPHTVMWSFDDYAELADDWGSDSKDYE